MLNLLDFLGKKSFKDLLDLTDCLSGLFPEAFPGVYKKVYKGQLNIRVGRVFWNKPQKGLLCMYEKYTLI